MCFELTLNQSSCPIWILPSNPSASHPIPSAVKKWLEQLDCSFTPGQHYLIPNSTLELSGVVVILPKEEPMWALAGLPAVLPKGVYHIEHSADQRLDLLAMGWALGHYQFNRYRSSSTPKDSKLVITPELYQAISPIIDSIKLVRDLVNTPAEDCGPAEISACVQQLAKKFDASTEEWIGEELIAAEFPMVHAVGRASHRAPRVIELTWGNPNHPKLYVIGKGVCFDTGGLDLKPSDGMRRMKKDMGGAAHAIALAQLIMQGKLPVHLTLIIPTVDNAVSGNALRPGDIIRTPAGLSVEIHNTDAEGRLILGDALTRAARKHPDCIVDFATLTGAARVALGPDIPALFCNTPSMSQAVLSCAEQEQDPLWELPLHTPYNRYLKSDCADITNAAAVGMAGATTAALYLEKMLVPAGAPWMHIDVYAWNDAARPGRPSGGEAMGLRAIWLWLQNHYRQANS